MSLKTPGQQANPLHDIPDDLLEFELMRRGDVAVLLEFELMRRGDVAVVDIWEMEKLYTALITNKQDQVFIHAANLIRSTLGRIY